MNCRRFVQAPEGEFCLHARTSLRPLLIAFASLRCMKQRRRQFSNERVRVAGRSRCAVIFLYGPLSFQLPEHQAKRKNPPAGWSALVRTSCRDMLRGGMGIQSQSPGRREPKRDGVQGSMQQTMAAVRETSLARAWATCLRVL